MNSNRKIFQIFTLVLTVILCAFSLVGCSNTNTLENNLIELKKCTYLAQNDSVKVSAQYGFNKAENTTSTACVYGLYFRLIGTPIDDVERTISLDFDGKEYSANFALNPVLNAYTAFIEIADFDEKSFSAILKVGSTSTQLNFDCTLPDNTLTHVKALEILQKTQADLLKVYTNENGEFTGKIIMRVLVKDGKSFWYIGLKYTSNNLKAFLLDGITGETLAIREVF